MIEQNRQNDEEYENFVFLDDSNKKSKRSPTLYTEIYPLQQFLLNKFVNFEQVKQTLLQTLTTQQFKSYKILKRGIYTYLKCKKCQSVISMKQKDGELVIIQFKNLHSHKLIEKTPQILESMKQINYLDTKQLKKIIKSKYDITDAKFYYLFKKMEPDFSSLQQVIKYLQLKGYHTLYRQPAPQSVQEFPSLLLTVSPQMKERYYLYGKAVCYDITYNVFKRSSKAEDKKVQKSYGLGLFTGLNFKNSIEIYGVSIMSQEKYEDFKTLFKGFFEIMGYQPQTIITDEQLSIKRALIQLKNQSIFTGHHCLDSFHIIKNLSKRLKNSDQVDFFRKMMTCRTQSSFDYWKQKTQAFGVNEDVFNEFLKKSSMTCFSQVPNTFVGFSISNSRSEKTNDMIKCFIERQSHITKVLKAVEKVMKRCQQIRKKIVIQSHKYQEIFKDCKIKEVRLILNRNIFRQFIKNYTESLKQICQKYQEDYEIISQYSKERVYQQWDGYRCTCCYFDKTDMICSHIISVLRKDKDSYGKHISKRWKIPEFHNEKQNQWKMVIGRPKNSRKNKL